MDNHDWMKDERVQMIDKQKLDFLQKLVFEMQKLSDQEKLPFLMALASSAKSKQISFSDAEIEKIIEVIKDYSEPQDINKMNKLLAMFHRT